MNLYLAKEWLNHFHLKTDEHSLHSPFFYHFYRAFLKNNPSGAVFFEIERERSRLLKSETEIVLNDFGAGSKKMASNRRKIKDIAKYSLSSPHFSQLLKHLIQHFQFGQIIELGTCLGINTAYMADANQQAHICTFEGDANLISIAKDINKENKNVEFINGNIDNTLAQHLSKRINKIDLVYVDANHTYEATMNYFNQLLPFHHSQSIFIFDDIHWSAQMKKAWEEIKAHPLVTSSIDIFDAGLIFFNPDFQKQHFTLSFY